MSLFKFNKYVVLYEASSPYRRVTVGRDPHTSKIVGIDFVLYKLPPPLLMDVDASCLAMMDLTAHHCGVGVGLHLKACYTVSVDVTVLKVTLKRRREHIRRPVRFYAGKNQSQLTRVYHAVIKGKHSHVSSVVDVVSSNDGITMVFYPNSS